MRKERQRREHIKSVSKFVRFRLEDANRMAKAASKANMKYSEYIRQAVLEKLNRENF